MPGFDTGSVSLRGLFSTSAQTFPLRLEQNLLDLTSKPFNRRSHHFCGRERTRGSVNYPPPGYSSGEGERERHGRLSQWETEMIKRLLLLTEKRGLVSFAACSFHGLVRWTDCCSTLSRA